MKWAILIVVVLVIPAFFIAIWIRSRANRKKGKPE